MVFIHLRSHVAPRKPKHYCQDKRRQKEFISTVRTGAKHSIAEVMRQITVTA